MRLLTALAMAGALALGGCVTSPSGETQLTTAELQALLPGKSVSFKGGDTATYSKDGRYQFRDYFRKQAVGGVVEGELVDHGRYSFRNDQVCVVFDNASERCDRYFRSGSRYSLITARGERFLASLR